MWASFFSPSGDIQIGMVDKKGQLEVEVIRARGLTQKPGSKSTPGKGKNMSRKQEYEICRWTGDQRLLSSSLAVTKFAFVWSAFQQGMCAWIYPCYHCPLLTIGQLHTTFQGMIFSNSTSVLEGTFAGIFLHILGESCIVEGLCRCRWSPLCLFHLKARDGEQMKVLWTNSLTDSHARIFCPPQCFKKTAGYASASVRNLYNEWDLILYHFIRTFFEVLVIYRNLY